MLKGHNENEDDRTAGMVGQLVEGRALPDLERDEVAARSEAQRGGRSGAGGGQVGERHWLLHQVALDGASSPVQAEPRGPMPEGAADYFIPISRA